MTELAGELAQAAGRRRAPSFRLIATQLEAPRGASSVWRAAAIYQLAQRHPELYEYRHLGVGHLAVLLGVRGELQVALMRQAEQRRWSRRQLEVIVRRLVEAERRGAEALGPGLVELGKAELGAQGELAGESEHTPPSSSHPSA